MIGPLKANTLLRRLVTGIGWTALAMGFERLVALAQSFIVARTLGAEEFGRYGLIYATAGLIASLAGLQLGLTATVYVSKHASSEPETAGGVVRLCELTALATALLSAAALWMAPDWVATHLLGGKAYVDVLGLALIIVLLSVLGGVEDGVLQGFEQFRALAIARVAATLTGFCLLLWLGQSHRLDRVLLALTLGTALRTLVVFAMKEWNWRRAALKASFRSIWAARNVLLTFSIPSMLASLVAGGVTWYATILVSRVRDGFHGVAFLTAGQQWRGTVLFATTFMASVAVPMMARLLHAGDWSAARQVHRSNLGLTLGAGVLLVCAVCGASSLILKAYGSDFSAGRMVFWLSVLAALPAVYIAVMQQILVTRGQMWGQLIYYLLNYLPLLVGYVIFVPRFGAVGFAVVTLLVNLAFCVLLHFRLTRHLTPPVESTV